METIMIYAILDKTKDLIYFTTRERSEEEQETTELLYTSNAKTLDQIKRDLRPIVYLENDKYYKNYPELRKYMLNNECPGIYVKVYPSEIKTEVDEFLSDYRILINLGSIDKIEEPQLDLSLIQYDCDIYNYLETKFGSTIVGSVYSYKSLGNEDKQFIKEFIKLGTREKKLGYLKTNLQTLNPDVLEFLPAWYRLSLMVTGNRELPGLPEYKNTDLIGGTIVGDSDVKDKFFDVFKLGEIYTGQEVKDRIQLIYTDLGIKKTPKISDLLDYFEVTSVSNKSSYRIDLRK